MFYCYFKLIIIFIIYIVGELDGHLESQGGTIAPIMIDHSGDNVKCVLTPQISGPHALYLNFAGLPLPGSPYPALVESGAAGVRVVLSGSGLSTATCGQQAEFIIDGSQAGPGMLILLVTLLCFFFNCYHRFIILF